MHFLVVDDDAVNQMVLRVLLENLGHSAETVFRSQDALKALSSNDGFAAVFADLELPQGQSGLDLKEQIKQTNADLPVVIVTGHPREKVGMHAHYLSKPVLQGDLAAMLSQICKNE